MRKISVSRWLMVFFFVCLLPVSAQAFNSAAHLYIADKIDPANENKIDLWYGSIAPDLAIYVPDPAKWPSAFSDTHYEFINLWPYAWSGRQKAFALGWYTHSEAGGSDYVAHVEYPEGSGESGYVVQKAAVLSDLTLIDPEIAHFVVEAAIDLLLKKNDARLGEKLFKANLLRSLQDRQLLVSVLVLQERQTDWATLVSSEVAFRSLVGRYAMAYSLPPPFDKQAISNLGAQVALDLFGVTVTPENVSALLDAAMALCKDDYAAAIHYAIEQIQSDLAP